MIIKKTRRITQDTMLKVGQRYFVEWKGERYLGTIVQILMIERRKSRCEAYIVVDIPDVESD